jgi:hypothetical protein
MSGQALSYFSLYWKMSYGVCTQCIVVLLMPSLEDNISASTSRL